MLQVLKGTIQYEGTDYNGWQIQPGQPHCRTIQGEIVAAWAALTGEAASLVAAGRTDAGVHARGQVISWRTAASIPASRVAYAINGYLPRDIVFQQVEVVPADFHARFSARGKTYSYRIDNGRFPQALESRYAYHVPWSLDLEGMREALPHFLGSHDFRSFCASGSSAKTFTREITRLDVAVNSPFITLEVSANGFLYNMVRIIVGTVIEVGKGKLRPQDIPAIINSLDRKTAGETAPPQGLCLEKVYY